MNLRKSVGIALVAFIMLFVSIVLFGLYGVNNPTMFTAGMFALFIFIFGMCYLPNAAKLEGVLQHGMLIFAIIAMSWLFAVSANNFSKSYVTSSSIAAQQDDALQQITSLEDNNIKSMNAVNELKSRLSSLQDQNNQLSLSVTSLQSQLAERDRQTQQSAYEEELKAIETQLQNEQQARAKELAQIQQNALDTSGVTSDD